MTARMLPHWSVPAPTAGKMTDEVKARGGIPFFTETCGLGMGKDQNHAPGRIRIAAENGYTSETLGAPIVIADGLQ